MTAWPGPPGMNVAASTQQAAGRIQQQQQRDSVIPHTEPQENNPKMNPSLLLPSSHYILDIINHGKPLANGFESPMFVFSRK